MKALLVLALVACGDNALPDGEPLAPSRDVAIVAHQDDDLLFMQPDLLDAVRAGTGVTAVYVTAGNGTKGVDFAQQRYAGLRDAYANAAGEASWSCGWIELRGHVAEHCRLDAANVSLVFLGYPDGGKEGEQTDSLLHLWEGTIAGATTVAARTAHYDRDSLVEAVAEVLRLTQPARIHTLEIAATHGRDHSDHMLVGAIALLAEARAGSLAELRSYRGYDIQDEQVDKTDAAYNAAQAVLAYYEACYAGCAPCGQACPADKIDPTHVAWLHRRYAVGFVRGARGKLRTGGQCLALDGNGVAQMANCAGAPVWHVDAGGELHSDADACLDADGLVGDACAGGEQHRWFVDDEGRIWSGVAPAPAANMDYAHLACLAPDGAGGVGAVLCGADFAPSWQLVPSIAVTDRNAAALFDSGRPLRIGDVDGDGKGDLCEVDARGLACAAGDGTGGFAAATRIDDPTRPLTIEPRSLAFGDVDGDGRDDACGIASDGSGILCATSALHYKTQLFSQEFGVDAAAGTAASFSIVSAGHSAYFCAQSTQGVQCVVAGSTLDPLKLSAWPAQDALVWPGELDGDGQVDWCAATTAGAACAIGGDALLSTEGAPWSFSLGGAIDRVPDADTGMLADVDGDGRADLCDVDADGVHCAYSQGHGFGPRSLLVPDLAGPALVLGDLDGDGHADACVATADAITCALSP